MNTEIVIQSNSIEAISELLDYSNGIVTNEGFPDKIESNANKFNLAKQTFKAIPDIENIYFSGEYPLIYFKTLSDFDPTTIRTLHKQIWNQGRVPLLFISCPHEIRIYNCYDKPLREDEDVEKLRIDRFERNVEEYARLESAYHQSRMDSGWYWDSDSGKRIIQSAAKKVDKLLVSNLRNLRALLKAELRDKIDDPIPYIHNVLGRSLFILYLEDRGVIGKKYYGKFREGATNYFEILESKSASYELFTELNLRFNGDLFTVTSAEKRLIGLSQLLLVRNCFYGHDISTGQLSLWRAFDFRYIPVELLSAIYEEFLHNEEDEEVISDNGVHYTPSPLVEFVLNEVLPYPDEHNTNYQLRILDPACGSGIFLVEAYKRLIERWRYVNPGEKMSIDPLRNILRDSIFGVEQHSEAIKVASFSLYLTMLSYLEPKSIWHSVKFPYLVQSNDRKDEHQGRNLFHGDTFMQKNYEELEYDIVVGNPPWKRGNLDVSVNQYLKKHRLGNEIAVAFLHKMAYVAPKAKIALVSTAKVLFNTTSGYEEFRRFLFNDTKVDVVVNFAALRQKKGKRGRKLFASATGPTAVIFYNGVDAKDRNETILYCTPKPQFKDSSLGELVIDASDIKHVPQYEAADSTSKVWKVAMWGTMRDFNLIKFISKNQRLHEFFDKNSWAYGNGFQLGNPRIKENNYISTLPNIANTHVSQYYTPIEVTSEIPDTTFRRLGCIEAYSAPHLLIKKGQSNKEFCASYLDYDCSFCDGVYGVSAIGKESLLKALTGYLNSRFTTYYLFLTSASWGIEREQIFATEVFDVPAPIFLSHSEDYEEIERLVTEIITTQSEFSLGQEQTLLNLKKEIDKAVLKQLGLNRNHLILIDSLIDYSLDFFQEGAKSQAILPTVKGDMVGYAKSACQNLSKILVNSQTNFWATQYQVNHHNPLTLIAIHFNNQQESETIVLDDTDVSALLSKLNKVVYNRYSESIYFRKVVRHYDSDTLFIVKPNEKRFWTEAMALEDSDSVALEMMSAVNE